MKQTRLGNLKPVRVMVRSQNKADSHIATAAELIELADVLMTQIAPGGDWFATSSEPASKYGTVLAVME
jgi:hypothetical protein